MFGGYSFVKIAIRMDDAPYLTRVQACRPGPALRARRTPGRRPHDPAGLGRTWLQVTRDAPGTPQSTRTGHSLFAPSFRADQLDEPAGEDHAGLGLPPPLAKARQLLLVFRADRGDEDPPLPELVEEGDGENRG